MTKLPVAGPHLYSQMRLTRRLAVAWIIGLLFWLLFAWEVTSAELGVGAVASALAVLAGYLTFRIVPVCFEPRLRWIAQLWRLPAMVATDLFLLGKHLLRHMTGKPSRSHFGIARFEATGDSNSAAAQRALAILFLSTSPNAVVLEIDRPKKEIFLHQVEPAGVPELLQKLEM